MAETEYLLQISEELGLLPAPDAGRLAAQAVEIARMLHALRSRVEGRPDP